MRQSVPPFAGGSGQVMRYLPEKPGKETMPTKLDRRHFIAAGSAAASIPLLSRGVSAQAAWPSRNIRMVCSYPAGGQTDLLARSYGDFITRQVGKTVVVENKSGASGAI